MCRRQGSPFHVGYPCVAVCTPAVVICIRACVLARVLNTLIRLGVRVDVGVFPPVASRKCRPVVTWKVCYVDVRAVWHVSRVVSGVRANTISEVWLLWRHRAHERLRAFKVPRLCACELRLLSAAVLM